MTKEQVIRLRLHVLDSLRECETNDETYMKFLDLMIDGVFSNYAETSEALRNLKGFLEEDDDNMTAMLTYFSLMLAYHPTFMQCIFAAPSVKHAILVNNIVAN